VTIDRPTDPAEHLLLDESADSFELGADSPRHFFVVRHAREDTVKLEGKRAIITGAASGIGRASALAFAREGATVLAADICDSVCEVAREVEEAGGRATAVVANVADEAAVAGLVERCEDQGGVDIMFSNAGTTGALTPLLELSEADWTETLQVNLLGSFFCIKHAAKQMLADEQGGVILCTASIAGLRSGAGPAPYSASKAALINLVQTSAWQLAGSGIRVNAICPGLIETGMTEPIFEMARAAGKEHKLGKLNPTRRAGQADEIAKLALTLVCDDGSYVNGQAIVVDGGLSASLPVVPGRFW